MAFNLQPRDLQAEKILNEDKNNPNIPGGLPVTCLKSIFDSSRTYGLFTAYFDSELYNYAATRYESHAFNSFQPVYSLVGITKVLEDAEISQRNYSPYRNMQRFLEQDFAVIHRDAQIPDNFKPYITARIDIQLRSTEGDFQIVSLSDEKAKITQPDWIKKGGIGYLIFSYAGRLEFVAKAAVDGRINLNLRGKWIPNPEDKKKLIPYWIDYTKLIVNGKLIFDKLTPAWFNKPYNYTMETKAGEEIKVEYEWLPHRSDT